MSARASIQELPPPTPRAYSGHESFPLRFAWIAKAVRSTEKPSDRDLFGRADAMVALGVGKNMVRSMRHWGLRTGMLEVEPSADRVSRVRPTELGLMLFGSEGHDPFMEDPGTVWLLHWALASRPALATWHFVFNGLRESDFERQQVVREILRTAKTDIARGVAEDTVERDVDCLLRTYVQSEPDKRLTREELLDCPLTDLGLIRRSSASGWYSLVRDAHESLSSALFAYALLDYWSVIGNRASTLAFDRIAYGVGSPGLVFRLTENAVVDRLVSLEDATQGALRYDETSGLRQVYRDRDITPTVAVRRHYSVRGRRS